MNLTFFWLCRQDLKKVSPGIFVGVIERSATDIGPRPGGPPEVVTRVHSLILYSLLKCGKDCYSYSGRMQELVPRFQVLITIFKL